MEKTKIQKLYEDPKSVKFVNHLIRSYLPIHKPTKVWQFDVEGDVKCNVCGHKLIDMSTVLGRMQTGDYIKDFIDEMRKDINNEAIDYGDRAIIKHVTHGAILAWQGENTTTHLCQRCIQELLEMVTLRLLHGDKNIVWLTNKMRRDEVFNHFSTSDKLNESDKETVKTIQKKVDRTKHATFGDIEALQQLKTKMENE